MKSRPYSFTLPPGNSKSLVVPIGGSRIFVRQASGAFDIQFPGENTRHFAERDGKFYSDSEPFSQFRIWNRSNVLPVTGLLIIGDADVDFTSQTRLPTTRNVGWDLDLDDNEEAVFPGAATDDDNYTLHGVPEGARRKMIAISTRGALAGKILVFNDDTDKLLMIIPGGQARAWEGDDNLRLKNEAGENINSTDSGGTKPDISVMEVFYV